jgi:hypothetical protein
MKVTEADVTATYAERGLTVEVADVLDAVDGNGQRAVELAVSAPLAARVVWCVGVRDSVLRLWNRSFAPRRPLARPPGPRAWLPAKTAQRRHVCRSF